MTFTHNTQRLPWKPRREKPAFRASPQYLFLSLNYIKCLQYNISVGHNTHTEKGGESVHGHFYPIFLFFQTTTYNQILDSTNNIY